MLFQINFTDLKTNEGINKMSAINQNSNTSADQKTYTRAEIDQMVSNLKASMEVIASPDNIDQILTEIDRITKQMLSFSEYAKKSILELTEAIVDYGVLPKHKYYQKLFVEGIDKIISQEELKLRNNNHTFSFSEIKNLPNLKQLVLKLHNKFN